MPDDEDIHIVSRMKFMKTKDNGKAAMQNPGVFVVGCVACCTSVYFCPGGSGKYELQIVPCHARKTRP